MWLAGGGIKGGVSVGQTDELGSTAVERPLEVKNLHATILKQMGMDPNYLLLSLRIGRKTGWSGRSGTHSRDHCLSMRQIS